MFRVDRATLEKAITSENVTLRRVVLKHFDEDYPDGEAVFSDWSRQTQVDLFVRGSRAVHHMQRQYLLPTFGIRGLWLPSFNFGRSGIRSFAHLQRAFLPGLKGSFSTIYCSNLQRADLSRASLTDCVFNSVDLRGASFRGAMLTKCSFVDCKFDAWTDFTDAYVHAPNWPVSVIDKWWCFPEKRGKARRTWSC